MAAVLTQAAFNSMRPTYSKVTVVSFVDGDGVLQQSIFLDDYCEAEAADLSCFIEQLDGLSAQYAIATIHCD